MCSILAKHPEIQIAAQEEVDQVLGDSNMVTSEMEKQLKYVANCIKESQRLIPVITGFSRGAVKDTELGGKVVLCHTCMNKAPHYQPSPATLACWSILFMLLL